MHDVIGITHVSILFSVPIQCCAHPPYDSYDYWGAHLLTLPFTINNANDASTTLVHLRALRIGRVMLRSYIYVH